MEVGRDIDDEEETGERADAKDKESRGQYGENASNCKRELHGRGSGNKTRQGGHRKTNDACKDGDGTTIG